MGTARLKIEKYSSIFIIHLKTRLAYIHDIFFSGIFMALVIFIFLNLWKTVFSSGSSQKLCGFSLSDMIWYLIIAEAVILSLPQINRDIDEQVKSGGIACYLIRPVHFILYKYMQHLAEVTLVLPLNLFIGMVLGLLFVGTPDAAINFLPGILILFLAVTLDFVIKMIIGILAFWIEDTGPVAWIYGKLIFTLGGLFIPLDFFPDNLKMICLKLPFRLIPYSTSRICLSGSAGFSDTLYWFVLWLVPLLSLLIILYNRGVKRLDIHGG